MNIIEIPISELKPYPNNPKKHTKQQVKKLAASLDKFKWQQPIVIDRDNVIVAGHGRIEAAKLLGWTTAPCKYADELTDDEIKAYRLADNRIAEAEYDLNLEFAELSEIEMDMSEFDFEAFSIDDIEEVSGYDVNNDDREYFSAAFTFPTAQKQQILKYLRKHKQEITDEIIRKSGE